MSKYEANPDSLPFSKTSIHQRFPLPAAMWLGTTSSTIRNPRVVSSSRNCAKSCAEPMSGSNWVGSVTS